MSKRTQTIKHHALLQPYLRAEAIYPVVPTTPGGLPSCALGGAVRQGHAGKERTRRAAQPGLAHVLQGGGCSAAVQNGGWVGYTDAAPGNCHADIRRWGGGVPRCQKIERWT
jgi:hypothetical protein